MKDCNETHKRVISDKFAQLLGVSRSIPGDCFCLDCKEPIAAWWNGGKPLAINGEDLHREKFLPPTPFSAARPLS